MNLLAINTARGEGDVALLCGGGVVGELSLGRAPGFDRVLFAVIDELLAGRNLALSEIDAFAAATGPGSFTGIRIGLSAAKALSEAHNRPLVGVSSLRALAKAVTEARPDAVRVPVLDARRGELFAGFYDRNAEPVAPETVGDWTSLEPQIRKFDADLVTNEPQIFDPAGPAGGAGRFLLAPPTVAGAIALIAAGQIASGCSGLPESVEANYIRRPSASPPKWAQAAKR